MNQAATQTQAAGAVRGRRREMRLNVWAIRNERDYDQARAVVDGLVLRTKLSAEDRERMEIMMTLMEAYEEAQHEIDTSNIGPLELLKGLMDEHAMSASDLGRLLGNRPLGCLILSGKRELSKAHIRKLAEHFAMEPGAFF